jgi:hypothetical protein
MSQAATPKAANGSKQRPALVRAVLFWVGVLFVIISPLVGAIPGPGGVFVFAIGAGLMLQNSRWAKKKYARFKKRHPKKGEWADWSLRRQSPKRRSERAKIVTATGEVSEESPDLRDLEPGCKH